MCARACACVRSVLYCCLSLKQKLSGSDRLAAPLITALFPSLSSPLHFWSLTNGLLLMAFILWLTHNVHSAKVQLFILKHCWDLRYWRRWNLILLKWQNFGIFTLFIYFIYLFKTCYFKKKNFPTLITTKTTCAISVFSVSSLRNALLSQIRVQTKVHSDVFCMKSTNKKYCLHYVDQKDP